MRAAAILTIGAALAWIGGHATSGFSTPATSEFEAIFARYLTGDADAAVRELAGWPESRLEKEAAPLSRDADVWTRAARALLHTEAAVLNQTFAARPGGAPPARALPLEAHSRTARELVEGLASRHATDAAVREFCRHWVVFAASFNARVFDFSYDDPLSELGRRHLADDPEVKLLLGSLAEERTGPLIREAHRANTLAGDQPNHFSTQHGVFSETFRGPAASLLTAALEHPQVATEARLRLGRLGFLVGRPPPSEGRALLERALIDAQREGDRFVSYLAALFLGAVHEHERRDEDAARMYRTAIHLEPRAHPAYIALSQLRLAQGRATEAWAVGHDLFDAVEPAGDIWNPWGLYRFGQFYQSRERLDAMRGLVARHFGRERRSRLEFPYLPSPPPQTAAVRSPSAALSPSPPKPQSRAGFRVGVEGVRIDVTVMDGDEPVPALTADDFVVLDNRVPQRIESATAISHLDLGLVLDVSYPGGSFSLREGLLPTADVIVRALRPADRLTLLTVEDSLQLLARDERDKSRLRALLGNIRNRPHAFTALWDAAYTAMSLLEQGTGRPVILLMSNHHDPFGGGAENVSWLGFDRARDWLKASGLVIDAVWASLRRDFEAGRDVGYQTETDVVFGRWRGDDLVKATGGRSFRLETPGVHDAILERLDRLRSGYVLTFTPAGVKTGDGWHKLTVRLRNKRGQVTARDSYYSGRKPR